MLQIFSCILKRDRNTLLMLVGGGELEREIHQAVFDLGLDKNVIFTGIRTDVPDLLQAMDVFVLPTKYEGFGNVLIEAQASGLKTITSLEGVPKSTKVTSLIEYISLKESPEKWAEQILQYKTNTNRASMKKYIRQAGFDVKEQAVFFQKMYLDAVQKMGK